MTNGRELPKLEATGETDGLSSSTYPLCRRKCGRVDLREIHIPSTGGGDWAPSVIEAPRVTTHRPFRAGNAEASVAAPDHTNTEFL